MESIRLLAVGAKGSMAEVMFEIRDDSGASLWMRPPGADWYSYTGSNLFKCLLNARVALEKNGLLLCCQGARRDVFPSGMQQQMDHGRFASVLGAVAGEGDVVDIFGSAEPLEVASVENQRLAVYEFFDLSPFDTDKDSY